MIYYLSRNYKDRQSAGNKAKTDNERIMADMGIRNIGFPQSVSKNTIYHFIKTLAGVIKASIKIGRNDILVLQYPLKKYFSFVCNMAHLHGAKVITIMHDLGSFRRKALTVDQEIRRLNHSDYIIANNESMKEWIQGHGYNGMLGVSKVWDYLSVPETSARPTPTKPYTVVYAGGLNRRKNPFLYEWGGAISTYRVRVYGNGFEKEQAEGGDKFDVMGFVKSDELIATARGDFGLVWDGDSIDACTGDWGEYLKYNTPHKTSLYLRCGLPVIIWSQAAMAPFVRDNGIGLCVDSLRGLDAILGSITPDDYRRMADNAAEMGLRLSRGHYIREALGKAISFFRS